MLYEDDKCACANGTLQFQQSNYLFLFLFHLSPPFVHQMILNGFSLHVILFSSLNSVLVIKHIIEPLSSWFYKRSQAWPYDGVMDQLSKFEIISFQSFSDCAVFFLNFKMRIIFTKEIFVGKNESEISCFRTIFFFFFISLVDFFSHS